MTKTFGHIEKKKPVVDSTGPVYQKP